MKTMLDLLRDKHLSPVRLELLTDSMRRVGHPEYADLCVLEAEAQRAVAAVESRVMVTRLGWSAEPMREVTGVLTG